jgi:hypothetical protein
MRGPRSLITSGLVLAALGTIGCGREIKVVLLEGFTGEARVVFDPAAGDPLEFNDFTCILRIPPSGELRVLDQSPLYRLHHESVQYWMGSGPWCLACSRSPDRRA